jgi:RimK family alpha-L-glutamate ligase
MNVHVLSARTGWHTDELCRALRERGHAGRVLPYESLVAGVGRRGRAPHATLAAADDAEGRGERGADAALFEADAILARIIPDGSLEQIIYRVDALHWLEERGVPVINSPRAIERCVDKFYTTALLHEAGLPVPHTVVCERAADAMSAIGPMLRLADVVIKPIFGSMGHGLVRVSDVDVAFRVMRALERVRSVFYLQQAIDHDGRDVRAFVVGGRVVGAIERVAPAGEWRTNVARGGDARVLDLPPAWTTAALGAAAAVGADYAGVDLIQSREGELFVLEVNGIPGWQGLQQATGVDVAAAIVDHLAARVVSAGRAAGAAV